MTTKKDLIFEEIGGGVKAIVTDITPQMEKKALELSTKWNTSVSKPSQNARPSYGAVNQDSFVKTGYTGLLCEFGIRKLLWEQQRKYEVSPVVGKGDGGKDIKVLAGWIDVKGSEIKPHENLRLMIEKSKVDTHKDTDIFALAFAWEKKVYFVGMEKRDILISEANLKENKTNDGKYTIINYEVRVKNLSIKPEALFGDDFSEAQAEEKEEQKETNTITCYLEGCENPSLASLGSFCCQEHKDKYWELQGGHPLDNKFRRRPENFRFTPRASTGAPGAPKDEDIIQAAREIFADDGVATGKPTAPQQSRLPESGSGIGDTP